MADLLDFVPVRILTTNAAAGAGYQARFYASGTTTPVIVYSDRAGTTPRAQPLIADASGVFAVTFGNGPIKCVIADATGATVYTVDPIQTISSGSGADEVSFAPTAEIPETTVQAAIQRVQANIVEPLADFGLGVTGTNVRIANIDATNVGSGVYRFDNTTTGTFPTGVAAVDTGIVETWRETAASAVMWLYHDTSTRTFYRTMASSVWGAWTEILNETRTTALINTLVNASALGIGQTWQSVTRLAGTSYQNTTGRPIAVNIAGLLDDSVTNIQVSANNSTWITVGCAGDNPNWRDSVSFVVPVGWYYRTESASATWVNWAELRT